MKPEGGSVCVQPPPSNTLLKGKHPQPGHRLLPMAQRTPEGAAVAVDGPQGKTGPSALCWVQTARAAGSRVVWR